MSSSSDGPSAGNSQESSAPPLGLDKPLLPPPPLGLRSSSSAFRLGQRSLTVLAPLRTTHRLSDWASAPPIAQRRTGHLIEQEQEQAQENTAPPLSSPPSFIPSGDRRSGSLSASGADAFASQQRSESEEAQEAGLESAASSTRQVQDSPPLQAKPQDVSANDVPGIKAAQSPTHSDTSPQTNQLQALPIAQADGVSNRQPTNRAGESIPSQSLSSSQALSTEMVEARVSTFISDSPEGKSAIQRSPSSPQSFVDPNSSPPPISTSEDLGQRFTESAERASSDPASQLAERNDGETAKRSHEPPIASEGGTDNSSLVSPPIQAQSNFPSPINISNSPTASGQTTSTDDLDSSVVHSAARQGEIVASSPPETIHPPESQASLEGKISPQLAAEHHKQPSSVQAKGGPVEEQSASQLQSNERPSPEPRSASEASRNRSTDSAPTKGDRAGVSIPEPSAIQRQSSERHTAQSVSNTVPRSGEATVVSSSAELSSPTATSTPPKTDLHSTVPSAQEVSATDSSAIDSSSPAINSREAHKGIPSTSGDQSTQNIQAKPARTTTNPAQNISQPETSDAGRVEGRSLQQQSALPSNPQVESRPNQQTDSASGESPSPSTSFQGRSSSPGSIQRQTDSSAIPLSNTRKTPETSRPISVTGKLGDRNSDSEPDRSQLPAIKGQESSSSDTVVKQAHSELPGLQRSPAFSTEATAPVESLSSSVNHPNYSTERPSSATTPPSTPPESRHSIHDGKGQTFSSSESSPNESSPIASSSPTPVQRSPESHSSPPTSAAVQSSLSDLGQPVREGQQGWLNNTGASNSKPEIQPSASSPSEEQAVHRSAPLHSSEPEIPSSSEQAEKTPATRGETSRTPDVSANQTPTTAVQKSSQYSPASNTSDLDSRTAGVGSSVEQLSKSSTPVESAPSYPDTSENRLPEQPLQASSQHSKTDSSENRSAVSTTITTPDRPTNPVVPQTADSVTASTVQPAAEQSQTRPVETLERSSSQTVDSGTREQRSIPITKGDNASSTTTPPTPKSPSLIQRIPSLMTTAFNVIGTVITNSLSEPSSSKSEPPTSNSKAPGSNTAPASAPSQTEEIQRSPEEAVDRRPNQQPESSTPESSPVETPSATPVQAKHPSTAGSNLSAGADGDLDGRSNKPEPHKLSEHKATEIEVETVDSVSLDSQDRPPERSRERSPEATSVQLFGKDTTQSLEITESGREFERLPSVESDRLSTDVSTQAGSLSLSSEGVERFQSSDRQPLESPSANPNLHSGAGTLSEGAIQAKSSTPLQSQRHDIASNVLTVPTKSTEAHQSDESQHNSNPEHGQPELTKSATPPNAPNPPGISRQNPTNSTPIQAKSHSAVDSSIEVTDSSGNRSSQGAMDTGSNPATVSEVQSAVIRSEGNDASPSSASTSSEPAIQRSSTPSTRQPFAGHSFSSQSSDSELLPTPKELSRENRLTPSSVDSELGSNNPAPLQRSAGQGPNSQPLSTTATSPSNPEPSSAIDDSSGDRSSATPQTNIETPLLVQRLADSETSKNTDSATEKLNSETDEVEAPPATTTDFANKQQPIGGISPTESRPTLSNGEHIAQLAKIPDRSTPPIQRAIAPQPTDIPEQVRVDSASGTSQSDTLPPSAAIDAESQVDVPVTQHPSSTEGAVVSPSVSDRPALIQQDSVTNQAQPSEQSRTTSSEPTIAQAQIQQQPSLSSGTSSTDSNPASSVIQQQLSDDSSVRSTAIEGISADLNHQTIPTSQQPTQPAASSPIADFTSSTSTDFSQPQVDASSDVSEQNQQADKIVSEPASPASAQSASPDTKVVQESSLQPHTVVPPSQAHSSSAQAKQQLPSTISQSSHNTGSAIQRRSTNLVSNSRDENTLPSDESQASTDVDRRSPIPQLPRVLKPISVLKPLIQPSSSSSPPVESTQGTSQSTQLTNSEPLTSSESHSQNELSSSSDLSTSGEFPTGNVTQAYSDSAQNGQISDIQSTNNSRPFPPSTSHHSPNSNPQNSDSQHSTPPTQASPVQTSSNKNSPAQASSSKSPSNQELPLPEQWSSIADLLSEPSVSISTSQTGTKRTQSASSSSIQAKSDRDSSASQTIQPQWDESLSVDSENTPDPETLNAHLDTLAREVYSMLRLKLERDRERNGGSYNGRLPW